LLSRKTCLSLAELYRELFQISALPGHRRNREEEFLTVDADKLYDFLYGHDYDPWFCNLVRAAKKPLSTRPLKDFILKLHTGESISTATASWSWEERAKLGQRYIRDLAEDVLGSWETEANPYFKEDAATLASSLTRQLELDGYAFVDGKLLAPEQDVINVDQEVSLLKQLYTALSLQSPDTAFHHLDQSEARYVEGNWGDSISNSRKYLECTIREVASAHYLGVESAPMPEATRESPGECRKYLSESGLLEKKEVDALAKVYGLLSHTGGHPYMAEKDQARLMRHLALTFSQFVLLRYRGYKKGA